MPEPSAPTAAPALGAGVFGAFGTAWVLWADQIAGAPSVLRTATILAVGVGIVLVVLLRYRDNRPAEAARRDTADAARSSRIFFWTNAVQWVLIGTSISVLNATGHGEWAVPAIIGIVGLHFFPLASAFHSPRHVWTGAALVTFALVYPFTAGLDDFVGPLGAGLILWASAAVALASPGPRAVAD